MEIPAQAGISSFRQACPRRARSILASPAHRLIYRPHPRSGVVDAEYGAANERIIAAIAAAWGLNVAALDGGTASLPWLVREQGLYLSGLLAIGLMSLAMVLPSSTVTLASACFC